jgi:putative peptide zinc metalloprotease protein
MTVGSDVLESAADVFALRPGVQVIDRSTAGFGNRGLVVISEGKYYQVNGLVSRLLTSLQHGPKTADQLHAEVLAQNGHFYDRQKIEHTLGNLASLSMVSNGAPCLRSERADAKRTRPYFALNIPLLPPFVFRSVVRRLSPVFSPLLVACLFPALLAGQITFWAFERGVIPKLYHWPSGHALVILIAANYAGLFLHEFGHAAACNRFKARCGSIGFALYLFFPALYTDVTDSWRLPARQRLIVDAGGTFMSLAAATLASLLFLASSNLLLAQLCMLYDFTVLLNLNPFFRMDGYWMMCDSLGIPNLMTVNRQMTVWLLRLIIRKKTSPPSALRLPRPQRLAYLSYYFGFIVFMVYFGFRFYIWYFPHAVLSFPAHMQAALHVSVLHGLSLVSLAAISRLVVESIPIAVPGIYAVRFLARSGSERRVQAS